MMSSTYDVAIVGGGPAGSTCARALVAGGARGFGWMFSGARLPVPRLLDRVLDLLPEGR